MSKMAKILEINNLSYTYSRRTAPTLRGLQLTVEEGEMVLLAGPSGCGKSTLLKAITGILQSEGRGLLKGQIILKGQDTSTMTPETIGLIAGTVYQTPDDQLFAMTVGDEVAFALENQGLPQQEIISAVKETLELVGLGGLEEQSIHALSGGQRQRLALASVLVSRPRLLLLDEPVSQMNPQGAQDFLQLLQRLNREQGLTVLIIEHRVNELAQYFPRLAVMHQGTLVYDGPIKEAWTLVAGRRELGIREPQNIRLCNLLQLGCYYSDTKELVQALKQLPPRQVQELPKKQEAPVLLQVENVYYTYEGAKAPTLKSISFSLQQGKVMALMGFNGAGKSTLMNLLGGLTTTNQGKISLLGQPLQEQLFATGYLRQEADLMLLADTVAEELTWNNKLINNAGLEALLQRIGLAQYKGDFPLALSKGQRLRTVLGAILARQPKLLLLDEPTTGQDQESLEAIKELLGKYVAEGGSIFFCTHDVELAGALADRVLVLAQGKVIIEGPTKEVLSKKEILEQGGLALPTMLEVSEALNLPPCLNAEEVAAYVTAMGGH